MSALPTCESVSYFVSSAKALPAQSAALFPLYCSVVGTVQCARESISCPLASFCDELDDSS